MVHNNKLTPEEKWDLSAPLLGQEDFPKYVMELFRSLRTKILYTLYEQEIPTIAVTSLESAAGKTTIAANLAMSMAHRDVRTLLIDGDLRRGALTRLMEREEVPGLSELLSRPSSGHTIDSLMYPAGRSLWFLPCGATVNHSSELLSSSHFRPLLRSLAGRFDVMIYDLPPIGLAVDPVVIHDLVAHYVLVVRAGSTNISDLTRKVAEYPQVQRKTLGVVLNRAMVDHQLRYYKNSPYYATA